jgi:hypothetical protein
MKRFYFLAASIGLLAACSGLEQPERSLFNTDGDLVEKVIFEVLPIKDGDDPETRASAVPAGGTVSFAWEENDMIGIYPNKGSQIYFTIEDGAGSSSASFDGGGWALKQNASYVSYYPFVADFFLSRNEIPVSFVGQKQVGTEPPFNGARYFLATEPTSSENRVLRFSYKTLNTIINVNATLPAGTYTKASLTIEEPFFVEEGTYSLDERTIVGTKFTNKLEIELEDVVLTEEATIPIYIMSAPVDLKGKEVTVRIISAEGLQYKCVKTPSKAYAAGTRYGLTCDEVEGIVDEQPNNVIYYTSSDGQIVTPYRSNVFGASIVNNEYADGQGIITFDRDVTIIGSYAFHDRESLTSITLPESVTSIESRAFNHCTNITSVCFPESLVSIGDYAFIDCGNLTSITFPEPVTSIGYAAFYGCSSLTSISFSESVMSIGANAFSGCGSLMRITIPESVTIIGGYAFYNCSSLNSIVCLANTPPSGLDDGTFKNTNGCQIYVPAESINAYKNAEGWSDYADRIHAITTSVPEAIDLGLPSGLKWASFNLGASKPEEYGDYYAWGETEPYYSSIDPLAWKEGKESGYNAPSYKWSMGPNYTLTKYCGNSEYGYNGFTDTKTFLDPEDDAAHVNLGVAWRMPTGAEWDELADNCTITRTTQNGVCGILVTASNGNSIFLPAAWSWFFSTSRSGVGSNGEYWSSSLDTESPNKASYVYFTSYNNYARSSRDRYSGFSIRPVYAE